MFWVTAQFVLVAFMLLWSIPWTLKGVPILFGGAAFALALWVFAHNPPGNFNIRPEPKRNARLVTRGPYRLVRHPMYVALLLAMAGIAAEASNGLLLLGMWVLLLLVLNFKAALEERLLQQRWPEYADYRTRTWRFIPRIW
ncbi:MAG: isoprenylcysteine carboxylmethyltransferase family protein [Ferrovum sp.]|nr:isoprenylcysteine carboxylmethyltransferase family protein [Ferrovum sp.]